MRVRRISSLAAAAVVSSIGWAACVSDLGPKKGSEGGPCYGDLTCDGELACVKDVCTRSDGGANDAAAKDTGTPADGGVESGSDAAKDGAACGPIPSTPCGCTGQNGDCCLAHDAGERCTSFVCPVTLRYLECSSDDECANRACCFKGDPIPAACGTLPSGAMDSHCEAIDAGQAGKPGCFIACVSDLHCTKYDAGACRPFYLGSSGELYGVCVP